MIYTVGHSNHRLEDLIELLRRHDIELLVDVRSSPYSRYVPQANRETLALALEQSGIAFRWLGDRLGGKPQGAVADYDLLRASPGFWEGLRELMEEAARRRTVIMCAEADHRQCHRYKLITPALQEQHVRILHIQADGTLIDEDLEPRQLSLF